MRLAVYTDYEYVACGKAIYGKRAFVTFLEALHPHVERLVLTGRLDPRPGRSHYRLDERTEFVGLPHYASLARPWQVVRSLISSLRLFWRLLAGVDTVWVLGPYPHAVALVLLARLRRRRVILGLRQDTPSYIRSRRPGRRWMHLAADLLESVWRALARRYPIVVVGPDLAARYSHAAAVLPLTVSLVRAADIVTEQTALARDYGGELTLLTVTRLEREKNPLLLAEIMALLDGGPHRWRLLICGEGPMRGALEQRLAAAGVAERVELRGYVASGDQLIQLYRDSHAFLHVSLTEGFPQVLTEAFAAGLPTVATAVGGVPAAAGDAALLVEPQNAGAAAAALELVAGDATLRRRLTSASLRRAETTTIEASTAELARFLAGAGRR